MADDTGHLSELLIALDAARAAVRGAMALGERIGVGACSAMPAVRDLRDAVARVIEADDAAFADALAELHATAGGSDGPD